MDKIDNLIIKYEDELRRINDAIEFSDKYKLATNYLIYKKDVIHGVIEDLKQLKST